MKGEAKVFRELLYSISTFANVNGVASNEHCLYFGSNVRNAGIVLVQKARQNPLSDRLSTSLAPAKRRLIKWVLISMAWHSI